MFPASKYSFLHFADDFLFKKYKKRNTQMDFNMKSRMYKLQKKIGRW